MSAAHELLVSKLNAHSRLASDEIAALLAIPLKTRIFHANEDIISQGEKPKFCAVVLKGMVARYHMRADGRRQYLAFHITGDMPDAQGLFIEILDHSVCAIDDCLIGLLPHDPLINLFRIRPEL